MSASKRRSLSELMDLSGHRALITGAAGHVGGAIAETLAEMGCDLLLVDLPGADFETVQHRACHWPVDIRSLPCNLESESDRARLADEIVEQPGGLGILINNAAFVGTSELQGWAVPFEQQSLETWRRAFEVNLTAGFDLCQRFAPLLAASGVGSIINVASIYAVSGPDYGLYKGTHLGNPGAYAASKGGLVQLTRWLAATLAPRVRVNAISPGGIYRAQDPVFVERYEARTPLGRMGAEEDLKGAVAYLASPLSSYVTGHNLMVDGGWVAV